MMYAFLNATIYTGEERIADKALITENNTITAIAEPHAVPAQARKIDCRGAIISPGLIDLQIYGGGGILFSENPAFPALKSMINGLVNSGTTAFLVTIATNSMEVFTKAIHTVKQNPNPSVLGLHFEGPFINPLKRGAHLLQYIKRPGMEEVAALIREAEGVVKMVTLAPEMCDASIIKYFIDNDIIVSAGHSNATYAEALEGFRTGIPAATHLFNAMSSFHHRDIGLPGAVMLSPDVRASIIADGIHVDYSSLILAKKLMKERLFLITDAVEEVKEGPYIHVKKEDRFTLPDGTLSGSRLSLLQAVKNCVEKAGIPLDESLRMASTYPAQLLRRTDLGVIKPGAKANLTIFLPDFQLKYTVVEGKVIPPGA